MKKKGFTLVELLVVIAVIGLLASIIIVSLNSARNRAKNTAIKQALAELRIAAEWYYDQNEDYAGVCTANPGTLGGSGDFKRIKDSIEANWIPGTSNIYCRDNNTSAGWCCEVNFMPNGGNWCTDHTGYSGSLVNCDGTDFTCQ